MKHISTLTTALMLTGGMTFTGMASADFSENLSRFDPDAPSNSGHDVRTFCGGGVDGFDDASGTIISEQDGGTAKVKIQIKDAKPNTLYTVWLRLKGNDQDGNSFGGAPITGGGATPLSASTNLDDLVDEWTGAGTTNPSNGFTTNHQGKGMVILNLDFPLEGGAYPFNTMDAATLDQAQAKRAEALATPTAIVDPRQDGVSGPFLIRVVSHCQDGLAHGLSPADRETWFQLP